MARETTRPDAGLTCGHYENQRRCPESATHQLFDDTGKPNPGGHVCEAHGRATVDEYARVLGERWTLRALASVPEQREDFLRALEDYGSASGAFEAGAVGASAVQRAYERMVALYEIALQRAGMP